MLLWFTESYSDRLTTVGAETWLTLPSSGAKLARL